MEESYHEFQKVSYLLKRGCYNAKRSELKNRVAVLCNLFAHSEVLRGSPQTIECDKRASCPLATELQSKKWVSVQTSIESIGGNILLGKVHSCEVAIELLRPLH